MPIERPLVVGAYATEPADQQLRRPFVERVLALPGVDGLEVPFGAQKYVEDRPWLWDCVPTGTPVVFTLVAATMEAIAANPQWGPASADPAGRTAFLNVLAEARDEVERVVTAGHRVIAVEVQSAPRDGGELRPTGARLVETLRQASDWEWCGAILAVEHCDAYIPGRAACKGFLSLDAELDAVRQLRDAPTPVAMAVNWGRSAIDGRGAAAVPAQIERAAAAEALAGLVLSGTCDRVGAFGGPWEDSHAPLHGSVPGCEPASILTTERVREAIAAAGSGLAFLGVKVGARPTGATLEQRLCFIEQLVRAAHG